MTALPISLRAIQNCLSALKGGKTKNGFDMSFDIGSTKKNGLELKATMILKVLLIRSLKQTQILAEPN
jgi:hypothetical protein